MRTAVVALGFWLAGAQAFAAQACCFDGDSDCGGCADDSEPENAPRTDCCISMQAHPDIDVVLPRYSPPLNPVVIELLPDSAGIAPWHADATDLVAQEASSRAEGPPLYLRFETLLI